MSSPQPQIQMLSDIAPSKYSRRSWSAFSRGARLVHGSNCWSRCPMPRTAPDGNQLSASRSGKFSLGSSRQIRRTGRKADILCECKETVVVIASADTGAVALVDSFAPALEELTLRPSRQSGGLSGWITGLVWPVLVAGPALRDRIFLFRVKKQTGTQLKLGKKCTRRSST